eukprot:767804-Hanusia_phi.AAC.4
MSAAESQHLNELSQYANRLQENAMSSLSNLEKHVDVIHEQFRKRVEGLSVHIDEMQKALEGQQMSNSILSKQNEELLNQITDSKSSHLLEQDILRKELQSELQEKSSRIESLESELSSIRDKLDMQKDLATSGMVELDSLKSKLESLERDLDDANTRGSSLQAEKESLITQLAERNQEIEIFKESAGLDAELVEELEATRKRLAEECKRSEEYSTDLEILKDHIDSITNESNAKQDELNKKITELLEVIELSRDEHDKELKRLKQEFETNNSEVHHLMNKKNVLMDETLELEKTNKIAIKAIEKMYRFVCGEKATIIIEGNRMSREQARRSQSPRHHKAPQQKWEDTTMLRAPKPAVIESKVELKLPDLRLKRQEEEANKSDVPQKLASPPRKDFGSFPSVVSWYTPQIRLQRFSSFPSVVTWNFLNYNSSVELVDATLEDKTLPSDPREEEDRRKQDRLVVDVTDVEIQRMDCVPEAPNELEDSLAELNASLEQQSSREDIDLMANETCLKAKVAEPPLLADRPPPLAPPRITALHHLNCSTLILPYLHSGNARGSAAEPVRVVSAQR